MQGTALISQRADAMVDKILELDAAHPTAGRYA